MKGLILKDLLMLKNNFKMLGIFLIIYFLLAIISNFDFSFALTFIAVFSFISTFSYDEFNKWDMYALTLPKGRYHVVKAKYLATLITILLTIIVTIPLSMGINYFKNNNLDLATTFLNTLMLNVGILIMPIVMYPLIYKFGIEKARIHFTIVFLLLFLGLYFFIDHFNFNWNFEFLNNPFLIKFGPILIILFFLFLFYLSYKISQRIYLKKDF